MGALVLVVVLQILLESLPVSSTGHIILLLRAVGWTGSLEDNFVGGLYYMSHGVAMVVTLLFFYSFWHSIVLSMWRRKTIFVRPFFFFFIIEAITMTGYFCCFNLSSFVPITFGFVATGLMLFSLRFTCQLPKKEGWFLGNAIIIGLSQIVAFVPGASRFASTYVAARWCRISSYDAFAISFIAALPLDFAGLVFGLWKLKKANVDLFAAQYLLLITILAVGAYVLLSCVWLLIRRGRLWWISWYMLLPIVMSLIL